MPTTTSTSPSTATPSAYGTSTADMEKQVEVLRKDVAQLTQQVADLISRKKDETMSQVKSEFRTAQAKVDSAISDVSAKGRETIDAFSDVADTFGDAVDDSLRKRPYATLAVVAGIGFLLGAVWRS